MDTTSLIYFERLQAKMTEETRQTFLATLTHDLRSPIYAQQKALEVIISGNLGPSLEDFSEYLQDIYKANEEQLRIINNILSVYHYESGKFELNKQLSEISIIINETVDLMIPLAQDHESTIIKHIEPDLPEIMIDPSEIRRVVTNLVSNAIKHTRKGTEITVKTFRRAENITVSVSDNGPGIPDTEISKIFQRYPTAKRKIGTGLGLYLSKQIIDAHNGKIWFETELGKGTTFYFSLPIV